MALAFIMWMRNHETHFSLIMTQEVSIAWLQITLAGVFTSMIKTAFGLEPMQASSYSIPTKNHLPVTRPTLRFWIFRKIPMENYGLAVETGSIPLILKVKILTN